MRLADGLMLRLLQYALEVELHKPATRVDATRLEALLHEAFKEVGSSGRTYKKAEIFLALQAEPQFSATIADHFEVARLAAEVALPTYRSAHPLADGTLDRFSARTCPGLSPEALAAPRSVHRCRPAGAAPAARAPAGLR